MAINTYTSIYTGEQIDEAIKKTLEAMPSIRLSSIRVESPDGNVTKDYPLYITVVVSGNPLKVGDEIQICSRQLCVKKRTGKEEKVRRFRMRAFENYTITESDLNEKVFTIEIKGLSLKSLLSSGKQTRRNYYPKYLRIRREITKNDVIFSEVYPFQVFGKYKKVDEDIVTTGRIRIS